MSIMNWWKCAQWLDECSCSEPSRTIKKPSGEDCEIWFSRVTSLPGTTGAHAATARVARARRRKEAAQLIAPTVFADTVGPLPHHMWRRGRGPRRRQPLPRASGSGPHPLRLQVQLRSPLSRCDRDVRVERRVHVPICAIESNRKTLIERAMCLSPQTEKCTSALPHHTTPMDYLPLIINEWNLSHN